MKLTPSSTARRKAFFAFSRSGGQPQIPSPVKRIAPNPSRLTNKSPPSWNVESRASGIAARSFGNPPVRTPAAPAEIVPKNVLRLIADKICCCDQLSTLTCSPRDEPAVVGRAVTLCEGGFRKEARSRLNPGLNVGCAKGFGENPGSATFVFHRSLAGRKGRDTSMF